MTLICFFVLSCANDSLFKHNKMQRTQKRVKVSVRCHDNELCYGRSWAKYEVIYYSTVQVEFMIVFVYRITSRVKSLVGCKYMINGKTLFLSSVFIIVLKNELLS